VNAKTLLRRIALASLVGLLIWQVQVNRQLTRDRDAGLALASELDLVRDENSRLTQSQVDPGELERLRKSESELLRLRAEAVQMRQQLKTLREARPTAPAGQPTPASTALEEPSGPVQTFTSTVNTTLAPDQSMVTGGWQLPDGKRGMVLMETWYVSSAGDLSSTPIAGGQVMIQARFVELPDGIMTKAGLDSLKTDSAESTNHGILDRQQVKALMALLETSENVTVLSAPRIITADGRQAQIKVVSTKTIGNVPYDIGPSLDVVPRVSADGRTTDLTVVARLKTETNPTK